MKTNYTQAYKELKELEVEKAKIDIEECKNTNKSIIIVVLALCFTAFTITFLSMTIGSHFKGEMNCTINGVNYNNNANQWNDYTTMKNSKVAYEQSQLNIELKDSAISCSFKGDIPTYTLLVMS